MIINIKVKPSSKENAVEKIPEGLVVKVKEKPENNKANIAVINILSKYFGISSSQIKIKRGLASRNKVIEILQ